CDRGDSILPRAAITSLCRFAALPEIHAAAVALAIVQKLLANETGNVLKARRNRSIVFPPFFARHFGWKFKCNHSGDHGWLRESCPIQTENYRFPRIMAGTRPGMT